jgi:serine/threonine protein kinase/Tol biopolymer transport system component/tetratricopeptide (TPR) repeat protein
VPDERWEQIKALFDSAVDRDLSERDTFLSMKCGSDTELRREVESLLGAHDSTGDFLENPFVSIRSLAEQEQRGSPIEIGSRLGAYRIEKEVGHGGMGSVYLATRADDEYRKQVAIKLIKFGADDQISIRRFRNERQILASLEHPYVARLLDGGTTADGIPYFVMEYVEGESLLRYCSREQLHEDLRLELFLKICSAVHYAHRRSIIHRDLKPTNILVQEDGSPKLLDFGIAKLLTPDLSEQASLNTMTGSRALTPAYASPEQLQGLVATVRSDVYSLGVMLFELLTGARAGTSSIRQTLSSQSSAGNVVEIHADLRAIVLKATSWEAEDRYESVEALENDIQRYLDHMPVAAASTGVAEFDPLPPSPGSIAILPFQIPEKDTTNAFLGPGITDALITRLSAVGRISVRPTSAVMRYARAHDVIRVGKELRVAYILEGRIRTSNAHVRVTVQLVSVESGTPVWASTIDENSDDLLKLEDSIAEQVAQALIPHLTGEEWEQLSKRGTASSKAHELYLRGRWHWTRSFDIPEELVNALVCYMEAIAEDQRYARAHAGVADYYISLGIWGGLPPSESFAAAKEYACTALEIDPTLAEAHAAYAAALWACDGDLDEAEQHLSLAITRNPDYPDAHYWFGQLNSVRGRHQVAVACLQRACKLSQNAPSFIASLASCHYNARQFDQALAVLEEAISGERDSPTIRELLAGCYLETGDPARALAEAKMAAGKSQRSAMSLCVLAHAEAANGKEPEAATLAEEIERQAESRHVSHYIRASAQFAAGNLERCFHLLEVAVKERDWWLNWLPVAPEWDPLRLDPRFQQIVSGASSGVIPGLPEAPARVPVRHFHQALAAIALIVIVAGALGIVWWRNSHRRVPFENTQITKLTGNGTANIAAVSPDGNSIAYATKENGAFVLRLKPTRGGQSKILTSPISADITDLSFTGNGAYVSIVTHPSSQPAMRALQIVPVSGGSLRQVMDTFSGPVRISQDGKQVAYLTANGKASRDELWISDVGGTKRRLLRSFQSPERFSWTSSFEWSPDGRMLACALEAKDKQGFLIRIAVIETENGRIHQIPSLRWQWIESFAWMKTSGLMALGQEQDASFQQIWYVPYPRGKTRRLMNDLNDYSGVSLDSNGTKLVSVQLQTLSNIYISRPAVSSEASQITPGNGRYFDLFWMPDGRILYASDATGFADLWVMSADGSGQRQLTSTFGRSYAPAGSPDSKQIVFHSNRSGNWNIWRMNTDGGDATQLTSDSQDSNWPQVTPDGNWVVYHHTGLNGMWNLFRVPAKGGKPEQLTGSLTTHPAVSWKDGRIASWYSTSKDKPNWKLAVFPPGGGEPLQVFDIASTVVPDSTIRWTPQGDGISFLDGRNGASNIWLQPLDGSPARPLTSFTSGQIYSFDWSLDGRLAFSRGMSLSDVVLIRDRDSKVD